MNAVFQSKHAIIAESHIPDTRYEEVRQHFSKKELAGLTLAICGDQRQQPAFDRGKNRSWNLRGSEDEGETKGVQGGARAFIIAPQSSIGCH